MSSKWTVLNIYNPWLRLFVTVIFAVIIQRLFQHNTQGGASDHKNLGLLGSGLNLKMAANEIATTQQIFELGKWFLHENGINCARNRLAMS